MTVGWLSNLIPARSPAGIRLTVERLVEQGVIRVHSVGRTRGYSLNDDHLLAPALRTIAGAQVAFIDRMQALFHPLPTPFAAVFGSAARGEMRADSDIDARRRRRGVG